MWRRERRMCKWVEVSERERERERERGEEGE